jgi:carboxymethylenebutenolidase
MNDERRRDAIRLYERFTHGGSIDRRAFMAEISRIAGGAAAANALLAAISADPAAAAVVPENDPRLIAGDAEWPTAAGRSLSGYRARPRPERDRPHVFVIHENRGLNPHIRDVTRRLAVAGFDAVAPDLLTPQGGTPSDEDAARAAIGRIDMAEAIADVTASLDYFRAGGPHGVGAVGFCWGGGFVNRLAAYAGNRLDAAVVFYGPAPPLTEAHRVEAPMLIHLAELDERVNATALPWVAALRNAGKSVRAIDYHGVNHAFHNDSSAERYDRRAAERAWASTLAFFREKLR